MTIDELRACIDILLAHASARGVGEVGPEESDLYWTVVSPDWRAMYEVPKPGVGSFSDDEKELTKVLKDSSRASSVDFERAGHLLRLISDALSR